MTPDAGRVEELAQQLHAHVCLGSWDRAGDYDCAYDQDVWRAIATIALTTHAETIRRLEDRLETSEAARLRNCAIITEQRATLRELHETIRRLEGALVEKEKTLIMYRDKFLTEEQRAEAAEGLIAAIVKYDPHLVAHAKDSLHRLLDRSTPATGEGA